MAPTECLQPSPHPAPKLLWHQSLTIHSSRRGEGKKAYFFRSSALASSSPCECSSACQVDTIASGYVAASAITEPTAPPTASIAAASLAICKLCVFGMSVSTCRVIRSSYHRKLAQMKKGKG